MEILTTNKLNNIYNLITKHAKYQKVLLLYDNSISNFEINLVYSQIKEICIFNKMDLFTLDEKEYYNGNKAVIYFCSGKSMLDFNLNKFDFINIYIPTDSFILPFISNQFKLLKDNCYFLAENIPNNLNTLNSIYLNKFYNFFNNIISNNLNDIDFTFNTNIINSVLSLNDLNQTFYFIDLEILAKENIEFEDIWIVDYIIINTLIAFFYAIKEDNLMLIDSYKIAKDDHNLIDKLFALTENKNVINLVKLNNNNLISIAEYVKNIILTTNDFHQISKEYFDAILNKVKNYYKNCNNVLFNLYLYNIFNI